MDFSDIPTIEEVLADKTTSFWLQNSLRWALVRDPIDASEDAAFLCALLDKRAKDALAAG